ncbi:MAG: CoA ester lyase [Pseudomonadota bacterium]
MGADALARANRVRSMLFVPGTRSDRFEAAASSGADMATVDLEDAVAPPLKAEARADAIAFLSGETPNALRAVRINPLSTTYGLADMLALIEARPTGGHLFLPKVAGPEEIRLADALLTNAGLNLPMIVLIETADALSHADAVAAATPRLVMVVFGAVDLSAELCAENAREPLLYARSKVVHAARRAGIAALDVPSLNFRDLDEVRSDAAYARSLGFSGKACIHPSNLAPIHDVFTPSEEEVAHAKRVMEAYENSSTGLAVLDGKLIELPVVRAAERVLALADRG